MNEIAIKLAVLQAPYYSEMELNEKLEEKFIDLQETLLNRTEQNRHKLNPKNVTGIWYLPACPRARTSAWWRKICSH